ncbi:MAG: hypothetical protein Q8O53_00455, partial [Candidatus Moranbacteria bacterium]|nr:hypothetical protein [Candidatus Moranbacteria bacterium]
MPQKKTAVSKTPKREKKDGVQKVAEKKVATPKKDSALVKEVAAKKSTPSKDQEEILLQTLRGMRDILPDEQPYWERVRKALSAASAEYGFRR